MGVSRCNITRLRKQVLPGWPQKSIRFSLENLKGKARLVAERESGRQLSYSIFVAADGPESGRSSATLVTVFMIWHPLTSRRYPNVLQRCLTWRAANATLLVKAEGTLEASIVSNALDKQFLLIGTDPATPAAACDPDQDPVLMAVEFGKSATGQRTVTVLLPGRGSVSATNDVLLQLRTFRCVRNRLKVWRDPWNIVTASPQNLDRTV